MVLRLKARESKSLPGLLSACLSSLLRRPAKRDPGPPVSQDWAALSFGAINPRRTCALGRCPGTEKDILPSAKVRRKGTFCLRQKSGAKVRNILPSQKFDNAGWSSPVARQAHNLKVVGSNPTPATKSSKSPQVQTAGFFAMWPAAGITDLISRICRRRAVLIRSSRSFCRNSGLPGGVVYRV
jgi:hypothetical protein